MNVLVLAPDPTMFENILELGGSCTPVSVVGRTRQVVLYVECPSSDREKYFQGWIAALEGGGTLPEVRIPLGHLNHFEGASKSDDKSMFNELWRR